MFAGLPGIGVGTLFYVLTAFVLPLVELSRLIRGDISVARWRLAISQFCFGVSIVASVALADRVLAIVLNDRSINDLNVGRLVNETFAAKSPESVWAAPIMASVLLLVGVLASMEVVRLLTLLHRPNAPKAVEPRELAGDFEL
jgi:hypothetical protein